MRKIVRHGSAHGLRRARPVIEAAIGMVVALGLSMGCSVDTTGLLDAGALGVGDTLGSGSGGKPSDAAVIGSGGAPGSGGKLGDGGGPGNGGKTGSGGGTASGGATATGGAIGGGGNNVSGSGGVSDRAGAGASGGTSSSGGMGGSAASAGAGGKVASGGGTAGQAVGGRAGSAGGSGGGGSGGGGPSCGPASCADGCCMDGTCMRGHANDRCGMGGVACGTCGHCFKCSSQGRCDVDPASTWNVVCGSATIQATSASGTVWDPAFAGGGPGGPNGFGDSTGPLPDPVCQFLSGSTLQKQTAIQVDTLTPTWNTVVSPGASSAKTLMSTSSRWSVKIVDDDGGGSFFSSEDICQVTPSLTAEDFSAGRLSFDDVGRCVHLSLQLVCAM